jgi:Holliday junction resolvasome RuvABC DNA-binding subunit
VELRDKISETEALEATAGIDAQDAGDAAVHDAVLALVSLGYKQADAWKMIRKILPHLEKKPSVEEIVRQALTG